LSINLYINQWNIIEKTVMNPIPSDFGLQPYGFINQLIELSQTMSIKEYIYLD